MLPAMLGRYPVRLTVPVAWGDMDALGHVNNTVYLRWFESARIEYFRRVGFFAAPGQGPILARATVDFRRPVTFPDAVLCEATVLRLGTTSVAMSYRVTSEAQSALAAEGEAVVVAMDYTRGEKIPLPDELRRRIEELEASAPAIALPASR